MHYNPDYVRHRPLLSEAERVELHAMAARFPLSQLRADARNSEELAIDFVYTSAKIEGNTYDRIDTDTLLRRGITAGQKRYSDAVIILNLQGAFARVMTASAGDVIDFEYVSDLHKMLMKDLLPANEQGAFRQSALCIGATDYRPLSDPMQLRTDGKFIVAEASKYDDAFERAIHLHCNLAYLQYFRDGNKRTARLTQTAAMVRSELLPLFFADTLIDAYTRATVDYCERGDYAPYVAFFRQNYALVIADLVGHPPPVHARLNRPRVAGS